MIGALIKAVGRTGAGQAISEAKNLLSRKGFASAFMQTSAGRVISGMQGGGKKETSSSKRASVIHAADPIARGSADGLRISKQTLDVLTNIDENLKKIVGTLDYQNQRDAAAAEEAASENAAPIPGGGAMAGATPAEQPGFMKRFMQLLLGLGLLSTTILKPLWDALKAARKWLFDMGETTFSWLKEKIWPILTEDIPKFFKEDIPNFFTVDLPGMFIKGTDFLKDKMDSIVNSISGMIGSIKSKVAELIFNLVDSPAAEFLLPESMRKSVKDFATSMKSSGDEAVKRSLDIADKKKQEQAAKLAPEGKGVQFNGVAASGRWDKQGKPPAEKVETPLAASGKMQEAAAGAIASSSGTSPAAQLPARAAGGMAASSAGVGTSGGMAGSSANIGASGGMAGAASATPETSAGTAGTALASAGSSGGMAMSKSATPVQSGGTGKAVASSSMAASAPEPVFAPNAPPVSVSAPHMNKQKLPSEEVNPVANVPDVFPNLGSLALLWYHNASVVV